MTSSAVVGSSRMMSSGSQISAVSDQDALLHAAAELMRVSDDRARRDRGKPTSANAATARSRAPRAERPDGAQSGSATWRPMVMLGFSEVNGSWNTIADVGGRASARRSAGRMRDRSLPRQRDLHRNEPSPPCPTGRVRRMRLCSCRSRIRRRGRAPRRCCDRKVDVLDARQHRRGASHRSTLSPSTVSRGASFIALLVRMHAGIEGLAQTVAQQVDADHRDAHGDTRARARSRVRGR